MPSPLMQLSEILELLDNIENQAEMSCTETKVTFFSTYGQAGWTLTGAIITGFDKVDDFTFILQDSSAYIDGKRVTYDNLKHRLNSVDIELQIKEEMDNG